MLIKILNYLFKLNILVEFMVKAICLIYKVLQLFNSQYPLFQYQKKIDYRENFIRDLTVFFIMLQAILLLKIIIKKI
jgi:hypothetical protein